MYLSYPLYFNLYYLPFDGDQRLITRRQIYRINYDTVESLNNDSIVERYMNLMEEK